MSPYPELRSRWRDVETQAEACIEALEYTAWCDPTEGRFRTTTMVTIRYTEIVKNWDRTVVGSTLRMPIEMFTHFWREFVPSLWERIGSEEEWLPS